MGSKYIKNPEEVTLPYDFIPLPEEYYYPYSKEADNLPKHTDIEKGQQGKFISGYIKYTLKPETALSVEIREGLNENKPFISGSIMRGRVRANAEILSHSCMQSFNKIPMLYRDVTNNVGLSTDYRSKLSNEETKEQVSIDIERTIRAGFLIKDGNDFYVVPAKKFSNGRHFLSIKEHRLYSMGMDRWGFYPLYFDKTELKEFNNIQTQIDNLSIEIKTLRNELKDCIDKYNDIISNIFLNEYSFKEALEDIKLDKNNSNNYEEALNAKEKDLVSYLREQIIEDNACLHELFEKMAKRWSLKAEIHIKYQHLDRNGKFLPYQKYIFYKTNNNGGIAKLNTVATPECTIKGYIYNSTNASSKRSHYIINECEEMKDKKKIAAEIINSYKQNYKKLRITSYKKKDSTKEDLIKIKEREHKLKEFYDIFDGHSKLTGKNNSGTENGIIVFYQMNKNNEVSMIGRTPYFKVPYSHSLQSIVGSKKENHIDYSDAIFGFINSEENKSDFAYKSRVRFSAININGNFNKSERRFLLTTPAATAYAMYLNQRGKTLSTYEDEKPKLNGYKYYRIFENALSQTEPHGSQNLEKIISTKKIIESKDNDCELEGKIYFNNLRPNELGLLLLSLDIGKLSKSKSFKVQLEKLGVNTKAVYEQIGGAKPYGYGRVKVAIKEMYIENKDNTFEALICDNISKSKESSEFDCSEYINGFLEEMCEKCTNKGTNYITKFLKPYIESKQIKEYNYEKDITWTNLNEKIGKGGGYPKTWRLKRTLNK